MYRRAIVFLCMNLLFVPFAAGTLLAVVPVIAAAHHTVVTAESRYGARDIGITTRVVPGVYMVYQKCIT